MNINIHLPVEFFERLVSAVERLATATERMAGPVVEPELPKPYPRDMWMESSNAQTAQTELEEALDAQGIGPEHWRALEARAAQRSGNSSEPE